MQTTIQKWGNSYALRLPKPIINRLGLRVGSRVIIDTALLKAVTTGERPGLKDWQKYLIPTGRKGKRNISRHIDEILYGKPR